MNSSLRSSFRPILAGAWLVAGLPGPAADLPQLGERFTRSLNHRSNHE
ncbi:MAG: hypothetical protein NTW21_33675 [Verrucomicrobia bacterium]|nr:hypothetical protein [Verrucomicrobiota bacterium]